jgi:hypothetical protein
VTSSDTFAWVFALLLLILCILSPLVISIFLRLNFTRLTDLSPRFGAIYHSLKPKSLFALNYHTWFLLRRLLFVATAIYVYQVPFLQVTLLLLQSLLSLCYLVSYMPFDSAVLNRSEIFNEVTLYLVCYPTLMFLVINDDGDDSYRMGWALIVLIIGNICVNVIVMVVMTAKMLRSKCKGRCCNKA